MIMLGKTVDEVIIDQNALRQIDAHRETIQAARDAHSQIQPAVQALNAFDEETQRIVADRSVRSRQLQQEYEAVAQKRASGLDAVDSINALKSDPVLSQLLQNEPAASAEELDPEAGRA
jgi:hypothetical protein